MIDMTVVVSVAIAILVADAVKYIVIKGIHETRIILFKNK